MLPVIAVQYLMCNMLPTIRLYWRTCTLLACMVNIPKA